MEQSLKQICEDFIYYQDIIKARRIFGSYRQLYPACSFIHLCVRQEPNEEMLTLSKQIIRENTGFFSSFRGNGEEIFVTMLATDDDPGVRMKLALAAYDMLRGFFPSSAYLPFLALIMSKMIKPDMFYEVSSRTKRIFDLMNDDHRFLTGQEDVCFAGMLAMRADMDIAEMLDEMEYCFDQLLEGNLFHHNAVQSISHALTLCAGTPDVKCENMRLLLDALESAGINFAKGYEQVSIAILANLGISLDVLVDDFCAVDDFLSVKDGYGFFGFSKRTRYMHDVMILSAYYMNGSVELMAAVTLSVLLEIQSEQAAAAAAAA